MGFYTDEEAKIEFSTIIEITVGEDYFREVSAVRKDAILKVFGGETCTFQHFLEKLPQLKLRAHEYVNAVDGDAYQILTLSTASTHIMFQESFDVIPFTKQSDGGDS